MKNKNSGKFLFWVINIFFSPLIFVNFFIFISFFVVLCIPNAENYNFLDNIFWENILSITVKTVALTFYFSVIFCLIKLPILPLLYVYKNKFQYINIFFNKFCNNNIFTIKTFAITLIADVISVIFLKNIIYLFVGVFSNYFLFLLFFKIIKFFHIKEENIKFNNKKMKIIYILLVSFLIITIYIFTYFFMKINI